LKDYIESIRGLSDKKLMLMLARKHMAETASIGVLGMGCSFPGANSPGELWRALNAGEIHTREYPNGPPGFRDRPRWHPNQYTQSGSAIHGGFLHDIARFNPQHYGIDPEEATFLDPQQRLLLSCTMDALAHANLTPDALQGERVGIFVGISTSEFLYAALHGGLDESKLSPYMGTGTALSATAGRIAMALGCRGPTISVDTACSSALTSVHLAVQSLRRGECDWAIVGASHLLLSPLTFIVFDQAGMLSQSGQCRPFDIGADGHVRSEGCGVALLRRARDAAEADQPLWGLIQASALHQDGQRPGMSVASRRSQYDVIRKALNQSGWAVDDVQYIEAQANGSQIGGQIEIEALADAYARNRTDAIPLYVGSAKANLGYMETASGMASLFKTLYALSHGVIPPQTNLSQLDPNIPWHRTSIKISREVRPWPGKGPRRAGISGFGFTGTNLHLLLEAVDQDQPPDFAPDRTVDETSDFWPTGNYW
jgi:acyl transferase domain-containing protein